MVFDKISTTILLDTEGNQIGPHLGGVLETVYVIPTSAAPTEGGTARGNTTPSSTYAQENLPFVNRKLDLRTKFSAPSNVSSAKSSEPSDTYTADGPQNLASYSLDPPNSFPQPTSIPAIDTISVTSPTPMGSIGDEMNTIKNLPSLPPIGSEMSENEKIPGIEEITSMQIPLSFEEEEPLEKSHATSGDFIPGHANTGHTNSSHANPTASSSNETTADARRREFVASNRGDFLETKSIHPLKLRSSQVKKKESEKEKNNQSTNKDNKDKKVRRHYAHSKLSKKRVAIPPPKPIDPIQPLMEKFQKEKEVGDIKEHVVEMEKIKPHEAIDKHLISIEPQPDIEPIENHLTKEQSDTIEPIENHQLKTVKQ